jgi:hypothetical protein
VFIDVGRDIGMTARKLFENAQYFQSREQSTTPNLNKHWSRIFGSNTTAWREEVCLFGYEPDQGQIARLRQIAQRYSSRGWRTTYILAGASGSTSSLPSLHRQVTKFISSEKLMLSLFDDSSLACSGRVGG